MLKFGGKQKQSHQKSKRHLPHEHEIFDIVDKLCIRQTFINIYQTIHVSNVMLSRELLFNN